MCPCTEYINMALLMCKFLYIWVYFLFVVSTSFFPHILVSSSVALHKRSWIHSKSLLNILPTQLPLESIYKEPIYLEPLKISFHVVASTILTDVPWLRLHHIVLLTSEDQRNGRSLTCAIDFSPVNQTQTSTLLQLIKGNSVPGELRMKFLTGIKY
jgi:hypothetical protein